MTAGVYGPLCEYLEHRYADVVVLTFAQMEDLLGFALPSAARTDAAWWTDGAGEAAPSPHHSEAWRLAHRSARPNLRAGNVLFERIAD
jgi:hypothetical protein